MRSTFGVVVSVGSVMAWFALGCSDDGRGGGRVMAAETIGPEGGVLTVDGAELTIPAGALSAPVEVTMRVRGDPPALPTADPASALFEIGPDDVTLALPATLVLSFALDGARPETPTIYTAPTGGVATDFSPVPTASAGPGEASASLDHFSLWGLFYLVGGTPGRCTTSACGDDPAVMCLECGIPLCVAAGSVCCDTGIVCLPTVPGCFDCPPGDRGGGGPECGAPGAVCCNGAVCSPPLVCADCGDGLGLACGGGCP